MGTITMTPTIEIKISGEKVVNVKVDFIGHVENDGILLRKERLGAAVLNLVHHTFVYQDTQSLGYQDFVKSSILLQQIQEFEGFFSCLRQGKRKVEGKLAILEQIRIQPEFRGRGLFKAFLWLVSKALKENLEVDYLFTKPFPFEVDKNDQKKLLKEKLNLEKMYARYGFQNYQTKHILRAEEDPGIVLHYMYTKLTDRSYNEFKI